MSTNTSISLDGHFQELIAQQVQSGRYRNASEVIRDALRLFEERDLRLAVLRLEVQKGVESGPGEPFDFKGFVDQKKNR